MKRIEITHAGKRCEICVNEEIVRLVIPVQHGKEFGEIRYEFSGKIINGVEIWEPRS